MGERVELINIINDSNVFIDLSILPTGIYFVRAVGDNGYYETKKFVLN